MKRPSDTGAVEVLANDIFDRVERAQGMAHISDGMGVMERKDFFNALRVAYRFSIEASKIIGIFLHEHGEFVSHAESRNKRAK